MGPTAEINSEWEFLVFVVVLAVGVGLVLLWSAVSGALDKRKGRKGGRWPTAKVRRASTGGWEWACWYCNEVSVLFATRADAESEASQHTDHVERAPVAEG